MQKFTLKLLFLIVFISQASFISQTLVASYPFSANSTYNAFWGVTQKSDTLWIGSDNAGKLYKVTKTGIIKDSLATVVDFNHGLAWDGTGFWVAEDYRTNGGRIYKLNTSGVKIDSILTGNYAGGIGGIALDGNNLWFAVYYPDFTSYPFAYAYKMNLTTKTLVDTIPLRGRQVQGIAVKGDTIFYVTDNFQQDAERIYAYRKAVGDTLFSFAVPDPDNDCDPRGLYWDNQNLWLIAQRVGNNVNAYRTLYKYSITGQGSPQITTSANTINFGNVIIGQTGNQNLTINNIGTAKLIISGLTMTNPRFSISPNALPDTINAGQSKNYSLGFTPNVFDTTSGELRIASNDAANPLKTVILKGKGVENGSFLYLSSSNFNYNTRRINSLSGFTFSIQNRGTQPLVINSFNFSGQRFFLDNTNVTFPITIDTQRTRTLRIWFNPNDANTFNDSAIINSNSINPAAGKIILSGTGQNNLTELGEIFWEGNIPANPGTSSQDYQPKSIKRIGDVNGDGINDVIVATENYWTICYNGNSSVTSDTLWKFSTYNGSYNTGSVDWEDAMATMPDINNDGIDEVVVGCGGGNEMVYALSGKTGEKLWEYGSPTTYSDGDIMGLRTDKDYNNDGRVDVLVSASGSGEGQGRHAAICVNGLNGQVLFNSIQTSDFTYDITTAPWGGAIGTSFDGGPYNIYGFNNSGANLWSYLASGTYNAAWSLKDIPDINSDGIVDIVCQIGFNGNLTALSGNNGTSIWNASLGASNNGKIIKLDDKDKDGYIDLSTSGPVSLYRLDSKLGTIIWSAPLGFDYTRGIDNIGDINRDPIQDIAVITQEPAEFVIINGKDGSTLFQYEFGTTIQQRGDRVIALNSIDQHTGNGTMEMVAGSRDGRLKCFSGGPDNPIGISNNNNKIPEEFRLYQNYPNPFNPVTTINFDLPVKSDVTIRIYDIIGREVEILAKGNFNSGKHTISWNAENIASGVYFYEISAGDFRDVKKMMLIK
ncbi:MAG: choice-of-anchor D domain-containing protein [Ignavibacteriae bacterium]|nr:MAG: choice-of-anchor D domain-containing protein [Ignavibacteriota bacterium]